VETIGTLVLTKEEVMEVKEITMAEYQATRAKERDLKANR
jgi:hypothetical protein